MKNTPTELHDLDYQSDRQQYDNNTIRPLPLIDNYHPYYLDPDFGFDPYWDTQTYNQHHLHFYNYFHKNFTEIEPDSYETDQNLNVALTEALVDPWQRKWTATNLAIQDEPMKASSQVGPVVTLTATVEERFVNTLISRDGEPDYVPLTINLELKYKRRKLYFLTDSGEQKLDGLVDTVALSSAIPEAHLRKNPSISPSVDNQRGPSSKFPSYGC